MYTLPACTCWISVYLYIKLYMYTVHSTWLYMLDIYISVNKALHVHCTLYLLVHDGYLYICTLSEGSTTAWISASWTPASINSSLSLQRKSLSLFSILKYLISNSRKLSSSNFSSAKSNTFSQNNPCAFAGFGKFIIIFYIIMYTLSVWMFSC